MTLSPWTHRGCDSIFDFVHESRSGWAQRDESLGRPTVYRVVLTGTDGRAYREVTMKPRRGRTLRSAIRDALKAFPEDVTTRTENGREIFGTFSVIE